MNSILKRYGTSTCLVCGHTLLWNEQVYCGNCHKYRERIISRLETDRDLTRVLYVCARHGAPVPVALFNRYDPKATAKAVNTRLTPLLDFMTLKMTQGVLSPQGYGVLWTDISNDLIALYGGVPFNRDIQKLELYNERMRRKLYQMFQETWPRLTLAEFVKTREKCFEVLFPEANVS